MKLKKTVVMLAAAIGLVIGLSQAVPIPALAATQAAATSHSKNSSEVPSISHGLIRARPVTLTLTGGKFTGTLSYSNSPIRGGYIWYWNVVGILTATSGHTADLRAFWSTALTGNESQLIGSTKSKQAISWQSDDYPTPISGMHVELCTYGKPSGGCANSPNV